MGVLNEWEAEEIGGNYATKINVLQLTMTQRDEVSKKKESRGLAHLSHPTPLTGGVILPSSHD